MFESHRVLHRYVIVEYLKTFGLSLSSLTLMYMIVLFFQKIDTFVKNQAPFVLVFEYLFYKVPAVVLQWTLPYGVLLGTLLTLGTFSRHSELTAMKAGGISLYRVTFPLLLIALLVSLVSFVGNEYLLPFTNQKTQYLLDVKVRRENPSTFFKDSKIWHYGDHRIYNIQFIDHQKKILKGLTLYQMDDQFRCIERIEVREAKWLEGKWRLFDGVIRDFGTAESVKTTHFKEMDFYLGERWDAFEKIVRRSEEMSYTELRAYVQAIRSSGYDPRRYLVDLYAKFSYPLLNLIMVLIGTPFALKTARAGGVASSIGISVAIGFAYAMTFYFFLSLGKSGVLPPVLSAWTPTTLFGLAGIFTLTSVRQ